MSSALSVDLRERVVHAVEAGASRRRAAERFGGSLASASSIGCRSKGNSNSRNSLAVPWRALRESNPPLQRERLTS